MSVLPVDMALVSDLMSLPKSMADDSLPVAVHNRNEIL